MMNLIRWKKIALPDCLFRFVRRAYAPRERFPVHTHDFAEIFLIEAGSGYQIMNGARLGLEKGTLCIVRPSDAHSLHAGPQGFTLLNLAFPACYAQEIEDRYFSGDAADSGIGEPRPVSSVLQADALVQAIRIFSEVSENPRNRFMLDRALMNLFYLMKPPFADALAQGAPDWLHKACLAIRSPARLAGGLPEFVRLAGRSPEHVARELKRYAGKTPTELISDLRLDLSAKLLCITQLSVLEVSLECGFENLSWFHRCFRNRFHATPLNYRKQNLLPVFCK
jgi:AraC family cel operon transcriptional repressor